MIYDISQPLFECEVFPGDPKPVKTAVRRMENVDLYNLTVISMCIHNGTHIDAPFHFLKVMSSIFRKIPYRISYSK